MLKLEFQVFENLHREVRHAGISITFLSGISMLINIDYRGLTRKYFHSVS